MKLLLISRDQLSPTSRLIIDTTSEVDFFIESEWAHGKELDAILHRKNIGPHTHFLFPRLGLLTRQQGLVLLAELESRGFQTLASHSVLEKASDKIQMMDRFCKLGIPHAPTICFSPEVKPPNTPLWPSSRYWIKTQYGSQGIGVSWANDYDHALAQCHLIRVSGGSGLLQRHIAGSEYRSLFCKGQILASMKKVPTQENPRANAHQGALVEKAQLSQMRQQELEILAQNYGLSFCGIDWILDSENNINLIEINPFPGWFALQNSGHPELTANIFQRLLTQNLEVL